jgi:succinyldiaminopimelate transaminase
LTVAQLPDFPWDSLAPYARIARAHDGGMVDLSVGSPVDPTPEVVRAAIRDALDAHAYPQTIGSVALREAMVAWWARRRGVNSLTVANVLPSVGSKELIALLPLILGVGPGRTVVHPRVAYPTYAVGAAVAGATALASDDPDEWPADTGLIWLNSPGNPDGSVHDIEHLRRCVARARELGAIIVNDECYAELNWVGDEPTPSILDPRVLGGEQSNVLAVYSLSKQSNLAGYRAGLLAGSSELISRILGVRKHLGLMLPEPVQAAMVAALGDDDHVAVQRERYRARRAVMLEAVTAFGLTVEHSEAGLYLWATDGRDCWDVVAELAARGVLVTPGSFYGTESSLHVRIALTVSDEGARLAADRLRAPATEADSPPESVTL